MNQQGILVVVSGFSGAGKGTLMKELLKRYDNYALSVSATTRQPREGEKDGEDYFFVSREYFQQMIEDGRLVEYAQYVNHYYGTPRDYVEKKMAEGKDVILEIEIQGALKVKKRFPDALLIFVTPPSAGELRRRLVGRGTETIEVINARLRRAAEEASGMEAYDYLLINDEIDACVEQMHQLITLQHSKTCYHLDFLSRMREELYHLDDRQETIYKNHITILKGECNMLHPSYTDLINVVNSDIEPGEQPVVQSRYSIVIAASRRARQLIAGEDPMVAGAAGKKPLSIAIDELYHQKVKILPEEETTEEEEQNA